MIIILWSEYVIDIDFMMRYQSKQKNTCDFNIIIDLSDLLTHKTLSNSTTPVHSRE